MRDFRLKEVPTGGNSGAWSGSGLFYANYQVYFRNKSGEVFDLYGQQVLLPNETLVTPLQVVEPTPDPLTIDDLIVASKVIR